MYLPVSFSCNIILARITSTILYSGNDLKKKSSCMSYIRGVPLKYECVELILLFILKLNCLFLDRIFWDFVL